ncbi:hypothetical protein [Pseudactinotalea sp. HY158]|uniref:hypothetical protein n=1 Tax=Pseudactinotalea sp. HY158 TaxID=2654547 RepID=UPI00129CC682|nr:hypothetical protein [Pseudactinotalea sp. HY158]QGH69578.1 hypothetical protein GCE65_08665 [Pseudactinotalea sp. HY158]
MIGPLFTINRDNVVRAAIAEVAKDLLPDTPVEVAARPHENGVGALILVADSNGEGHEIVFRESSIADCLQQADTRAAAQDLIDQFAGEVRRSVDEALG